MTWGRGDIEENAVKQLPPDARGFGPDVEAQLAWRNVDLEEEDAWSELSLAGLPGASPPGASLPGDRCPCGAHCAIEGPRPAAQGPSWHCWDCIREQACRQLAFQDPKLLRGVPITRILKRRAVILGDRPCTAEYYSLSKTTTSLDTFISHNWSTPRWQKYLTLVFHFNTGPALMVMAIAVLVMFLLTACATLPVWEEHVASESSRPVGVWCQAVGGSVFFITLFFWHEIGPFFRIKGATVFLDKTCVHQLDTDLKGKGIMKLPAFLSHSQNMVVLYSHAYLTRLWTVYELATFMLLYPDGRLLVRPVFFPAVALAATALNFCRRSLFAWLKALNRDMFPPDEHGFFMLMLFRLPFLTLFAVVLWWWSREMVRMTRQLQDFDIRQAHCLSEHDRQTVEDDIVLFAKYFGLARCDATKDESLSVFNKLVQEEVPRLLNKSIGKAGIPYKHVVIMFIVFWLYACDEVSAMLFVGQWDRKRFINAVGYTSSAFGCGPLCIYGLLWLCRSIADVPPRWAVVGLALIVALTNLLPTLCPMYYAHAWAVAANSGAPSELFVVLQVLLILVTLLAYEVVPVPALAFCRNRCKDAHNAACWQRKAGGHQDIEVQGKALEGKRPDRDVC